MACSVACLACREFHNDLLVGGETFTQRQLGRVGLVVVLEGTDLHHHAVHYPRQPQLRRLGVPQQVNHHSRIRMAAQAWA